jgi:hypothetical protein
MARSALSAVAMLVLALGLCGAPRPALADAGQLCRAGLNLTLAPLDALFSPIITAKDMHYGVTEINDRVYNRILGAVPGYVFLNTVQLGGAVIRVISGLYELLPGMVTLFREGSQPPLYRAQDEAWALYSRDVGPCPVRIGSSYNTINEG